MVNPAKRSAAVNVHESPLRFKRLKRIGGRGLRAADL